MGPRSHTLQIHELGLSSAESVSSMIDGSGGDNLSLTECLEFSLVIGSIYPPVGESEHPCGGVVCGRRLVSFLALRPHSTWKVFHNERPFFIREL